MATVLATLAATATFTTFAAPAISTTSTTSVAPTAAAAAAPAITCSTAAPAATLLSFVVLPKDVQSAELCCPWCANVRLLGDFWAIRELMLEPSFS